MLKRSQVNSSIAAAVEVFRRLSVHLPPFAYWRVSEWLRQDDDVDEIRQCMLGWDVTDFGSNDFTTIGRTLFTLRNGRAGDQRYPKSYAEKFIVDPEGQRAPAHFHRSKREDIINRGGGNILVELTMADDNNERSEQWFDIQVDGRTLHLAPGAVVRLTPGESLCIPPRTIHQFWGEEGTGVRIAGVGYTISGEVSNICDDWEDNFFLDDMTRFPKIEEDQPRSHFLCHEYPASRKSPSRVDELFVGNEGQ